MREKRKTAHGKLGLYKGSIKVTHKKFDCSGYGCDECVVCDYNNFFDWVSTVAPSDVPTTIGRDNFVEEYLKIVYE